MLESMIARHKIFYLIFNLFLNTFFSSSWNLFCAQPVFADENQNNELSFASYEFENIEQHKKINVTVAIENENSKLSAKQFNDQVLAKLDLNNIKTIKVRAINPKNFFATPSSKIDDSLDSLLKDLVARKSNNGASLFQSFSAAESFSVNGRAPNQVSQDDETELTSLPDTKKTWDQFNKFYNLKYGKIRKALIFWRTTINGSVTAFATYMAEPQFPNSQQLSFDPALVHASFMGIIVGLLSAGIMNYDYLLNQFLSKSLIRNIFPNLKFLATGESYARWYLLEVTFVGLIVLAQQSIGIINIDQLSAVKNEVQQIATTSVKTLATQGIYENAILHLAESMGYSQLIAHNNFKASAKMRKKIETGKFMGSLLAVAAAVAQTYAYTELSNYTFATLGVAGASLYGYSYLDSFKFSFGDFSKKVMNPVRNCIKLFSPSSKTKNK